MRTERGHFNFDENLQYRDQYDKKPRIVIIEN